jgi:hypothetical protein
LRAFRLLLAHQKEEKGGKDHDQKSIHLCEGLHSASS